MPGQSGFYNRRVTIKRRTPETSAAGDISYAFVTVAGLSRIPAKYRPERGWERMESGRLEDAEMGTLMIRSTSLAREITAADIVVFHGPERDEEYSIKYISNPDQRNRELNIQVERGTAVR